MVVAVVPLRQVAVRQGRAVQVAVQTEVCAAYLSFNKERESTPTSSASVPAFCISSLLDYTPLSLIRFR